MAEHDYVTSLDDDTTLSVSVDNILIQAATWHLNVPRGIALGPLLVILGDLR